MTHLLSILLGLLLWSPCCSGLKLGEVLEHLDAFNDGANKDPAATMVWVVGNDITDEETLACLAHGCNHLTSCKKLPDNMNDMFNLFMYKTLEEWLFCFNDDTSHAILRKPSVILSSRNESVEDVKASLRNTELRLDSQATFKCLILRDDVARRTHSYCRFTLFKVRAKSHSFTSFTRSLPVTQKSSPNVSGQ